MILRLCASILFVLFILAVPVHAQDTEDKFLDIQVVKTDDNITAWLVEDHSIPVIAMEFAFKGAGAKNNSADQQGLARLASNTMDEGAGDLTSHDFQKMLRDKSISLSFGVSRDHFSGSLKTLTQNKDDAFHMLKLALTEPRFDKDAIDRMRDSNKSRIKSSVANPRWIAARIQNDKLFEGHPYALNSGGTLSTLDKITADDLRAFHKTLGKNQLVIAVAGDITAGELKTTLTQIFGAMPDGEVKEPTKKPLSNLGKTYIYEQTIPQSSIEIAQPGINRKDEDYYAAYVMNFILGESGFGSRLMDEIREKRGLTYGIYSYFRQYDEMDTLNVTTSTVNKSIPEMLSLIHQEWNKMKDQPVSEKELSEAKSYLIGSLPLSLTSTGSIANILLSLQLDALPIDYLDTRADQINAVQISDIQSAAQHLLDTEKMLTVIVGAPEGLENAEIITKLPNVE